MPPKVAALAPIRRYMRHTSPVMRRDVLASAREDFGRVRGYRVVLVAALLERTLVPLAERVILARRALSRLGHR